MRRGKGDRRRAQDRAAGARRGTCCTARRQLRISRRHVLTVASLAARQRHRRTESSSRARRDESGCCAADGQQWPGCSLPGAVARRCTGLTRDSALSSARCSYSCEASATAKQEDHPGWPTSLQGIAARAAPGAPWGNLLFRPRPGCWPDPRIRSLRPALRRAGDPRPRQRRHPARQVPEEPAPRGHRECR